MTTLELLVLVGLTEALLHCIPWKKYLKGKELPRLAAYVFGVLGFVVPFSVWLYFRVDTQILITLWEVIAVAGGTVFAAYGAEHYADLSTGDVESREREKLLREAIDRLLDSMKANNAKGS